MHDTAGNEDMGSADARPVRIFDAGIGFFMAEKDGKEGRSRVQWWRELPGWVQAVVAVLTLIGVGGAGGAVIHAAGSNSHNQPTHNPSTSEAPRLVPGQPIWSGPIAIASGGGGIDLDYNPPTHGSNNLTFDPFNG